MMTLASTVIMIVTAIAAAEIANTKLTPISVAMEVIGYLAQAIFFLNRVSTIAHVIINYR